jgi:hypothetical protein
LGCPDVLTDSSYRSPRLLPSEDGGTVLLSEVHNFQFAQDIIPDASNLHENYCENPEYHMSSEMFITASELYDIASEYTVTLSH